MKKLKYMAFMSLTAFALLTGCKKNDREKIDLSSIHTTAAKAETMGSEKESMEAIVTTAPETTAAVTESNPAVTSTPTRKATHKSGSVSIEYPEIYDTGDATKESTVNKLLKDNALAFLKAYEVDDSKDTVDIKYQVVNADRKRITVLYTGYYNAAGAAHPLNVFYTNTVDLNKMSNIRLNDFVDPYTMAGYVLSSDCQFADSTAELRTELMKIKNDTTLETYTDMFTKADFSVSETFPQSFSYEKQGNIYFSIPMPHALGDYAIVKYTPDTK